MAEKNLKYALLLDVYGSMLSEKQSYALEMYYCDDLSLSEIAEHMSITRQGVRDQIKHAEDELDRIEDSLGLVKKMSILSEIVDNIRALSADGNNSDTINELCDKAMSVLEDFGTENDSD